MMTDNNTFGTHLRACLGTIADNTEMVGVTTLRVRKSWSICDQFWQLEFNIPTHGPDSAEPGLRRTGSTAAIFESARLL